MKTNNIVALLLAALVLISCTPEERLSPTPIIIPGSPLTGTPFLPTVTPVPSPEKLSESNKLTQWVGDYVRAYGGNIAVNGTEMNLDQLTAKIRNNEDAFIQTVTIGEVEYVFFVVNETPLAVRNNGQWEDIPIRWLADRLGVNIGTNLSNPFYDDVLRAQTDQLAIKEFNHAISSSILWWVIEPKEGQFDFSDGDRMVRLAMDNGMSIEGDDLITPWSFRYVPYLQEYIEKVNRGEISKEQARDAVIQIMREHIVGIMDHYKGKITQWVVTLEKDSRGPTTGGSDMFTELVGDDYVDIAFEIARETDSHATLYYNDAYNETRNGWKYQDSLKIVRRLKEKNLIDAVGVEMHVDGANPPNKEEVIATLKSYEIRVIVSSMDINMSSVKGTPEERNQKQASILENIFEAAMESGVCRDFYFWEGLGDKNNWLERMEMSGVSSSNADPTIFSDDLRPKPSYYSLKQVLFRMFLNQ